MNTSRIFSTFIFLLSTSISCFAVDFSTDFSKKFRYEIPHNLNTTTKAISRIDGVLGITIQPGMYGTNQDQKSKVERAQLAQRISDRHTYIKQEFLIRVEENFKGPTRTQIAQIKFTKTPPKLGSPPIAVYVDRGGHAKCSDYSSGQPDHKTVFTKSKGIRLDDGAWHHVIMELLRDDENGQCRIIIDNKVIIARSKIDTNSGGSDLTSQIGLYRDELPFSQTVFFDNWSVLSGNP